MKKVQELRELFIIYKTELTSIDNCIKWAEERLKNNEGNNDQDIVLLAGSTRREEAEKFVSRILE